MFQTGCFSYPLCICTLPVVGKDSLPLFLKRKIEEGNNYSIVCTEPCFIKTVLNSFMVIVFTETVRGISSS